MADVGRYPMSILARGGDPKHKTHQPTGPDSFQPCNGLLSVWPSLLVCHQVYFSLTTSTAALTSLGTSSAKQCHIFFAGCCRSLRFSSFACGWAHWNRIIGILPTFSTFLLLFINPLYPKVSQKNGQNGASILVFTEGKYQGLILQGQKFPHVGNALNHPFPFRPPPLAFAEWNIFNTAYSCAKKCQLKLRFRASAWQKKRSKKTQKHASWCTLVESSWNSDLYLVFQENKNSPTILRGLSDGPTCVFPACTLWGGQVHGMARHGMA